MRREDWSDASLIAIGKNFQREAYNLASELHGYGADASTYLLPPDQQADRQGGDDVCLPPAFADALMALLLSLPRKDRGRGRPRKISTWDALQLAGKGLSKRGAAEVTAAKTGEKAETVRRRLSGKSGKGGRY